VRPFSNTVRALAIAGVLAALGGCSEYLDRRDTISTRGGDAVSTNVVTQMVDPWPRDSADRNIAFNGDKMESAFERYRTNKVIQPQGIGTSTSYQGATQPNNASPVGPTAVQPAAPVK
jgi:hypothetical protein